MNKSSIATILTMIVIMGIFYYAYKNDFLAQIVGGVIASCGALMLFASIFKGWSKFFDEE